jgi:hypothetical protein
VERVALYGNTPAEVVMLRFQAIVAVALLFAAGCSAACAGDFLPRAANGLAAVGDDPGARSASADVGATAAMSESEASVSARSAVPARATPARRGAHLGTDEVAADVHAAPATGDVHAPPAAGDDDKGGGTAAPAHKSRAGTRWQSLLPGVMK